MVLVDSPTSASGGSVNTVGGRVIIAASTHPRLFKVPVDQRRANPAAYTPFLFSFGPYHALLLEGRENNYSPVTAHPLLDGAHLKEMTASGLLSPNAEDQLRLLVQKIEQHEAQIRAQYVQWLDTASFNFRHLARVLALDSITIVAATMSQKLQQQYTPLIYPVARLVLSDAMLLENQVPIIVLECALESLVQKTRAASFKNTLPADPLPSLEDVILWYCQRSSPFPEWTLQRLPPLEDKVKGEPPLSFLYDYLLDRFTPTAQQPDKGGALLKAPNDADPSLPTASHLARCGVRFRPCDTGDIRFGKTNDVLLLPRITVSDTTVRVLHNLLAYEATQRHPKQYTVVSYVHFIDCLIDNVDDVEILTAGGIICNKLSSNEELATMWNKLCTSVSCRNTISNRIVMAQLDALSKEKWRRWRASFIDIYWEKQPWLLFSIFAAIILFVLSLLQTIYTIMAF